MTAPDRMEAKSEKHGIGLTRYTMEDFSKLGLPSSVSGVVVWWLDHHGVHYVLLSSCCLTCEHGSFWSRMDDKAIRAMNALQLLSVADIG